MFIGITLSVCLSVSLSVCLSASSLSVLQSKDSCPAQKVFFVLVWHLHAIVGTWHMRRYVAHFHDPDTSLTFDLKVKYKGLMLCVPASFLIFAIVKLCLARVCITMVRCVAYIHDQCMTFILWPLYQNYIFTMKLSLTRSSLLFDICIPNRCIYMCVSPDNMLCTFLTFVWPLTYMWVRGLSLVTHSLYLLRNYLPKISSQGKVHCSFFHKIL